MKDLTVAQRLIICNGAGPKGWGWLVPDLCFREAANVHDLNYWIGGGPQHKLLADTRFFIGCLETVLDSKIGFWRACLRLGLSFIYWFAVAVCGWCAFHWGRRRGLAELKALKVGGDDENCSTGPSAGLGRWNP
jgi:hypothetical protein